MERLGGRGVGGGKIRGERKKKDKWGIQKCKFMINPAGLCVLKDFCDNVHDMVKDL